MTTKNDDALCMWTVYAHPLDYPERFVARKFEVGANGPRPTTDIFLGDTLADVRGMMRMLGLTCLTRSPQDQPQIVETWI